MAAYIVVDGRITDHERFKVYMGLAEQTLVASGGRYLARGGETTVLEGDWDPARVVVIEFPDVDRATAWYDSVGYLAAREVRAGAADMKIVLVEGVATA